MKSVSVFFVLIGLCVAYDYDESSLIQLGVQEDEVYPPAPAPVGFNKDLIESAEEWEEADDRSLKQAEASRGEKGQAPFAPLFSPIWWVELNDGTLLKKNRFMKNTVKTNIARKAEFTCKTWADTRKEACSEATHLYLRPSASFLTLEKVGNFSEDKCCLNVCDASDPKCEMPAWKIANNYFMPNGHNVNMSEILIKGPTTTFMKDWHKTEDGAMLCSIDTAKWACQRAPSCKGFTHQGTYEQAKHAGAVWVYFKTSNVVGQLPDEPNNHWTSYVTPKTKDDKLDFMYLRTKGKSPRRDRLP